MVFVFWHFMYRDIGRFSADDERLASFDANALAAFSPGAPQGRAHVVHFWNPDCACNRFNRTHTLSIMEGYRPLGVTFSVAVPHPRHQESALQRFPQAKEVIVAADINRTSSPASAVFDALGQLVYFGPYSEGAFCADEDGTPVELMLDELLNTGRTTPWLNLAAIGCYCPWPANT